MTTAPSVRTRRELVEEGKSHHYSDQQVRRGTWTRAAPSTYFTRSPDLLMRVQAAVSHAGEGAVVTGWAGCAARGLPYVEDTGAVPVLVPAGRRRVSTAAVRVMPTTRPPQSWIWRGGARVAMPTRCVVDAARSASTLRAVRSLVLGAIGVGEVDRRDLEIELAAGTPGGSRLCRRALVDAARGAASAPEAELADDLLAAATRGRVPAFLLNADVFVDGVFVGRPDGWLVGLGLGWEVDSREHHAGTGFDLTLARHDAFAAHGLTLLHVTPRRLRALGATYVDMVAKAAAAHRDSGRSEPAGLSLRPRGPLLGTGGRCPRSAGGDD